MSFLTRLSLQNRALIALISVVAVIFGVIGAGALKQELFPSLENPEATISANYEGATPQAVEREVTIPLEGAIGALPEVEDISSVSSAGSSSITVSTKYGENSDDVVRAIQRAIAEVETTLPEGVEPSVFTAGTDDIPVLALSVTSDADPARLASDLEDIVTPELTKVEGVSQVSIAGTRGSQVEIRIRRGDLEDRGASLDEIAGILQANGVPASAGDLRTDDGAAPVEVGERLRSVESIEDLVVTGTDGPIRLAEVADVRLADEPATSMSRTNGRPSLSISIMKESDANTVDVSHAVAEELPDLERVMGGNTEFVPAFDQAPFIEQSIHDLLEEGLLGLAFAVLVILVFLLSVRATLITAISIPLSLLIALIGLWMGGETLNMLTLGALTISVGRVVDDSIVVIEAIRRRHAAGGEKSRNILAAVAEVAGAITASTLTTVAVFLPLAFVSGQTGEMFRPFALTATIALLSSLFVALTIVPVLAHWFLRRRESRVRLTTEERAEVRRARTRMLAAWRAEAKAAKAAAKRHSILDSARHDAPGPAPEPARTAAEVDELAALNSPVTRLQRSYLPVIAASTKHPVLTVLVALAVLAGTSLMIPQLKTELFGDTGQDSLQVSQTFAPGTDLAEADVQAGKVEEILAADERIESYQVSVGESSFGFSTGGGITGSHIVTVADGSQAQAVSADLQERFDELEGAGQVEVVSGSSAPGSQTIDVTLTATDPQLLEDSTAQVVERLEQVETIQTVTSDVAAVQPVIEVRVDHEAAAEENLTEAAIGRHVQRAIDGEHIGEVVIDDISHSVLLFDRSADTAESLRDLRIPGRPETPAPTADAPTGPGAGGAAVDGTPAIGDDTGAAPGTRPRTIALSEVAEVREVMTAPTIRHTNSQRSTTVSVTPASDDLGAVSAAVESAVGEVDLPAEVSVATGGATAEQEDAFSQLGLAMLAAILIVFVIMVATFKSLAQPLILLVSIPFAATGSLAALLLTDTPLGLTSMIGLLMLIGIVVTNAIVLIDLINHFRARGAPLRAAVVHGARLRYRPILMTAAATIFALVPMALGMTGGGVFISKPLAVVVIGGLVSSTLLTLILVPVLYLLLETAKERRAERRRVADMARGEVLDAAEARAEDASP
ncbi:HAE1 family hydrophobic/amphiphilic exporter-1 [Brevibacterium sanguinis]|uniref:HAE1 family hydrophobic/amphiphilic exporter-1 n=2 Tax=Brevibacterium TaxID=1696 RepID=A0A366IGN2_9MICO|nr:MULTISPECIES: efflux RND transporter permease subunit [Brevibacterium]RBP63096.1 HAE1 family hydrophobic/amphiphilic exporter-1 [Brevibacterium sanguinis]RBP69728.1 HAE1 family hydrophobic/amphiphilic exporter-1 [Brevibacterium celere]